MFRNQRVNNLIIFVLIAFFVGSCLMAVWLSAFDIGPCKEGSKDTCAYYKYQPSEKILFAFGVIIRRIAHFLKAYDGLITALATIAIAYFTRILWLATDEVRRAGDNQLTFARRESARQAQDTIEQLVIARQSSNAAQISATAAVDVAERERPWIFITPPKSVKEGDGEEERYFCAFDVSNHGRMPAIIEEFWTIAAFGEGMHPPIPIIRDEFHGPLGPHETWRSRRIEWPDGISVGALVDIKTGESFPSPEPNGQFFFFYVDINYTGVDGRVGASRFCWRWDVGLGLWIRAGGGEHNYVR